jgi:hypothetical protein
MLKKIVLTLGLVSVTGGAMVSNAQAMWGCAAKAGTAWGLDWDFETRHEAELAALYTCRKQHHPGSPSCRIVACYPNIDTSEQAHAAFPQAGK